MNANPIRPGEVRTPDKLSICTVKKLHQREYVDEVQFSRQQHSAGWEWISPVLLERAELSVIRPAHDDEIRLMRRGLQALEELSEWRQVTSRSAQHCTVPDAISVFGALERRLLDTTGPTYTASKVSGCARKLILDALASHGNQVTASKAKRQFVSVFSSKVRRGRELISDLSDGHRPPLSATPHATYGELREATKQVLQSDIDRILEVCRSVLDRYDAVLLYLRKLDEIVLSEVAAQGAIERAALSVQTAQRVRSAKVELTEPELDSILALIKRGQTHGLPGHGKSMRFPPQLLPHLRGRLHDFANQGHVTALLRLDVAPPAEVLLACALIIQLHTHWNFISVLELDRDSATVKNFPHKLQSVKPRTSDETPPVFVERTDDLVLVALRVLADRWDRLVGAKRITVSQRGLWYSSRSVLGDGEVWPVVGWSCELRRFTAKYGLPSFSLEQVRVQCLALIAIGARGLSGVMQAAGHVSDATSLRYVDKLLLRRLNAANTLEFERRLEKTIVFMMGRAEWTPDLIAYPVGDGASCADPSRPPDERWISAGMCRAEDCHRNDGCSNRRIVITRERIEEVARTKAYYVQNWKRLADENSVRFESVHLPQMLFNLALYGVLRRGPYRHLVAAHET